MSLEILEPGLFTTVQDLGRFGLGHLGVPTGGAADPWSHALANYLVANEAGAATLEMTAAGPTVRARSDVLIAVAGADLGALVEPGGRAIAPGQAVALRAGDVLALRGPARGGLRAYLAVAGGVDVPLVLGSRSTCLAASFGGFAGRVLRAGDVLPVGGSAGRVPRSPQPPAAHGGAWPGPAAPSRRLEPDGAVVVRVTDGPTLTAAAIVGRRWSVAPASDRMGLRLAPAERDAAGSTGDTVAPSAEVASHGVTCGTVQLPPDGHPIVLLADHQPTGGYPVPAVVISADLPVLGQLGPGDAVRFELVGFADARLAARDARARFEADIRRHRSDARWEDLWRSAGG